MSSGGGGSNEVPETKYEKEMAKITSEEWNRYKTVFQPLMDTEAKKITAMGVGEKNAVSGMINAGVTKQFDSAADRTTKGLNSHGIDPSSGVSAITMADVSRDKSEAMTPAMVGGDIQVDKTKVAGLQNLVNMARGDAGQAMRGVNSIATDQVRNAIQDASTAQQSRNDTFEGLASVAGAGMAAANLKTAPGLKTTPAAKIYNDPWPTIA